MHYIGLFIITLFAFGCRPEPVARVATDGEIADVVASVFDGRRGQWVDLSHPFSERTIYWPTDTEGFVLEELAHGHTEGGWFYSSYRYSGAEHGGTHLDAPIHFSEGGQRADEVPLSRLIGPAMVLDVSDRVHADYLVSVDDLKGWEEQYGVLPDAAILLVRTGWDKYYPDRAAYLGTDLTGPDAVTALRFPGLDPDAAGWIVENRRISAFGIDTASIDYGQSSDFRAHVTLAEQNIPGFENLTDLDRLPARGAYVVALPMKIEGGSGGPLRIVAYVP
jgi:kynurenine formamidase